MGNLAGGVHLANYLFGRVFKPCRSLILLPDAQISILKVVTFLSVHFHFERADFESEKVLSANFNSYISARCPLGSLRAAKNDAAIDGI